MAAGIPLEKAQKYIEQFNALLLDRESLDPFTEKKIREELSVTQRLLPTLHYLIWMQ